MLGLLAPLVVLLGLAALAVHWAIVRMTASVRRAQVEIASRGAGSLEPITELGGPEELAPIADAVNRLLSRLRTMLEAERAFAANSAHQLRTPVAAALAQAQLLASELKGPGSERAKGLALELARLSHTVEKLLQLARAESGLGLSRDAVDLNRLAAAVVDQFTRNTRHAGRIALSPARGSVIVEGDLDILGIAIENLVDNAFKHGGDDVRVTVSVSADGAVSVADTGRGVREEELGGLSKRFVRGSTPGAGSGLGLSIVAAIAEQSGGRLRLSSPGPGKGFVATIELRLHTPHTPPRVSAPPRPTGQSRANAPERAE